MDTSNRTIYIIEFQKEKIQMGRKNIWRNNGQNFLNLMKDMNTYIQKLNKPQNGKFNEICIFVRDTV